MGLISTLDGCNDRKYLPRLPEALSISLDSYRFRFLIDPPQALLFVQEDSVSRLLAHVLNCSEPECYQLRDRLAAAMYLGELRGTGATCQAILDTIL